MINFLIFLKSKSIKKKLKIISFGIKKKSDIKIIKIKKEKTKFFLFINYNNKILKFIIKKI